MMGNLFNKHFLSDYISAYRKKLQEDIDKYEITQSSDIDAIVSRLVAKATIQPIEIGDPVPSEPVESTRPRKNMFGETYNEKVFEIKVSIPYTGNRDLFFCQPSTSRVVYLDGDFTISVGSVYGTIVMQTLDEHNYQLQLDKVLGVLNANLPTIHAEIRPWNDGLETFIRHSLEQRRGVVASKHAFMEKIGLKVNPGSGEFLVPPTVKKKPVPVPVSETTKAVAKEKIPVLQEEVYTDIKEVLYNVGKAIERKPSLYAGKQEEDLRDIFLLFLETRYESATGVGEAFNKKGRTDILLKYAPDGTNLFVAECKFWRGQKKLTEAIDQLLGYLTHRDTKTALMFFVDQKEMTAIVSTIKIEITKHPNFSRQLKDSHEHSMAYEFSLPGDTLKKIQMEVMLFHFPPAMLRH